MKVEEKYSCSKRLFLITGRSFLGMIHLFTGTKHLTSKLLIKDGISMHFYGIKFLHSDFISYFCRKFANIRNKRRMSKDMAYKIDSHPVRDGGKGGDAITIRYGHLNGSYNFSQKVIVYIGIVVNRIGSLVIEPILRKTKFLTFIDYPKFVKASKIDEKIEILSENNNMCRSLVSLCVSLLLAVVYEWMMKKITFIDTYSNVILLVLLFVILLFSNRKQTKYVVKRCNANLGEK
jgi:hypothetical protein